jgi:hypothetical protein
MTLCLLVNFEKPKVEWMVGAGVDGQSRRWPSAAIAIMQPCGCIIDNLPNSHIDIT